MVKDKLNYAATAQFTYKITKNFGLTADGTVATRFPRINEYAGTGPTEEQYKRVTIPLLRGGLFYHNNWINLTSKVYDRILERCAPVLFSGKNFREEGARATKAAAKEIVSKE